MRVLMINVCCGTGSTGRICTDLAASLEELGHEVKIAYGRGVVKPQFQKYAVRIGSNFEVYSHALCARLFDASGLGSKRGTKKFIAWVKEYNPDVIHLHNIHGYYINVPLLFEYLKTCGKPIIWTLHDCWPFTGHCAYFDFVHCEKWTTGCHDCPQLKTYPLSVFTDGSERNYKYKCSRFTSVENMTLVTPSMWLAGLVKKSFLKIYRVEVIPNGIDAGVFSPHKKGIFREKYGIEKKVILGVATPWSKRKGLDDFIKLSKVIGNEFCIFLVGLSKKQLKKLPKDIYAIEKTLNTRELAELYSGAYVFLNLTYEDNYPTTNLEAQSCGTPVITYRTGGSVESCIKRQIIKQGDIYEIARLIEREHLEVNTSLKISKDFMLESYLDLYKSLVTFS